MTHMNRKRKLTLEEMFLNIVGKGQDHAMPELSWLGMTEAGPTKRNEQTICFRAVGASAIRCRASHAMADATQFAAHQVRQIRIECAHLCHRVFSRPFGLAWGIGCGVLAYQITSDRQLIFLPVLLWPVFLMWQVVPVMLSTAQESVDFNFLLRFPVSFRSYLLLYLFFGLFDPSSLLGGMCMVGIWIGVVIASPGLALWITAALALFALFNFLLTRMIFAWIERWLAQRRTREILGIVILFVFLSFQLLTPALHSHSGHAPFDRPSGVSSRAEDRPNRRKESFRPVWPATRWRWRVRDAI